MRFTQAEGTPMTSDCRFTGMAVSVEAFGCNFIA